jgi:phytoene dehydrogenase-like protein
MTWRIEEQIERFAPGFRKRIISRRILGPSGLEQINAKLAGGDIAGGAYTLRQILFRPLVSSDPYRLGKGIYLCSASAPPGGGVHGMCGYNAALRVLGVRH